MKKSSLHLFIGLLVILVLDFMVGNILEYYYFNQSSGFQYRTTYALEKTQAELLVFGSSRANHHYEPKAFEDTFKKTFYNTGRDGQFVFYQTALLEGILDRYNPELIIYDFAGSFEHKQEDYDRLSSLLPYYNSNKKIRKTVNLRSSFEPIKVLSRIYPYNSMALNIIKGNMEFNEAKKNDFNGYVPLFEVLNKKIDSIKTLKQYDIDSTKIKQFRRFLRLSKEQNIPVYVVYSPIHYLYDSDYSIELCRKICNEEGVPFYDFSKKHEYLSLKSFFSDPSHLNDSGAKHFSNTIAKKIKKSFENSNKVRSEKTN